MNTVILISAALLGFAGSLHCVGMCGPLALSLPAAGGQKSKHGASTLLYFTGKTVTYVLLGLLFGLMGHQLVIAGWQRGLSLLLGFGMLFFALMAIFRPVLFHSNRFTDYVGNRLSPVMGRVMARAGFGTSFVFGMLNGLLPCGLLYVALSAAAATGSPWQSALFMGVFGLATIPLMLFLVLFSAQLGIQYRHQVRRLLPVFTALVAVLLILRGLDLGIPYLSPQIDGLPDGTRSAEAASCH